MDTDPGGVGVFAALAAGLVSFLSPCVLPLVPGYLSAVTGIQPADLDQADWRRVLVPSLFFIGSFSVIFILLGLTATALGQTLRDNQDVLEKIAGVLMIVMGAIFVGSMFIARLSREWHVDALLARAGRGGPVVAGAAFAIAWTPCVGPTLGAINALAAVNGNVLQGMGLLAVYSAGLAIPFLLTALAFSRMTTAFAAVKRHYWVITTIGGLILIAMGILILTGEFFQLNIEAQKLTNDLGLNL
jgi:cytochrome c-type biogenesis protein